MNNLKDSTEADNQPTELRMPAEWEPHRATWICWPHCKEDWHAKFDSIDWAYVEMVRAIGRSEFVEIICAFAAEFALAADTVS